MGFRFAHVRHDTCRLARPELEASILGAAPAATITPGTHDPLAAFEHRDIEEDLEWQLHQHFAGCTCQMRGR